MGLLCPAPVEAIHQCVSSSRLLLVRACVRACSWFSTGHIPIRVKWRPVIRAPRDGEQMEAALKYWYIFVPSVVHGVKLVVHGGVSRRRNRKCFYT